MILVADEYFAACDQPIGMNVPYHRESLYLQIVIMIRTCSYILILMDSSNTITDTFSLEEPSSITINIISFDAICHDGNGTASALVTGGIQPYNYLWDNIQGNATAFLTAGTHLLSIIDSNNCIVHDSLTINQPDSIALSAGIENVTCFGLQNGISTISVTSGAIASYEYALIGGNTQTNNIFYNLIPGYNTVIVTDANNCSNDITFLITEPFELIIDSIVTTNASCYGECDGIATPFISGGTPAYGYVWSGTDSTSLCAGFYNLIVSDANNCATTISFSITEPNPIMINIVQNGNQIEATTGFATYQWYDENGIAIAGATADTYTPPTSAAGEYHVVVTDTDGCEVTSTTILFLVDGIVDTEISINIYPNPTKGVLYVNSTLVINEMQITDILGNRVPFQKEKEINSNTISVDLSAYNKGVYFIQLSINEQLIIQRIILH